MVFHKAVVVVVELLHLSQVMPLVQTDQMAERVERIKRMVPLRQQLLPQVQVQVDLAEAAAGAVLVKQQLDQTVVPVRPELLVLMARLLFNGWNDWQDLLEKHSLHLVLGLPLLGLRK